MHSGKFPKLSSRVLAAVSGSLFAGFFALLAVSTVALASQLVLLYPGSGWNTVTAYPNGQLVCPYVAWQHSWAGQFYDDRVSSPTQLWFDYSDVYNGTPDGYTIEWNYMYVVDGFNPNVTGRYYPASRTYFTNDWTVSPQRSFAYNNSGNNVYVETSFGVGGGCNTVSDIVFIH